MMTKKIFISLIVCLAIVGYAIHIKAVDYVFANFNARDRQFQSVPTGHTPGKDNGGGVGAHMVGEDCGICHRPNGKASNYIFTTAGTLYEDKAGRRPLAGGEVILQDKDGNVISMTSNEVGNFWTYTPIVSYPYAVAGYGSIIKLYTENSDGTITPGDTNDTRSWLYKTWVKNGDHVVYMVTVAPIGGGSDGTSRMGCSMHHSPFGSRGALWGSRNGTLSIFPSSGLSFKKHILPILMSRCASCHLPGAALTRLVMKSDIDATYPDPNSTQIDHSYHHDLTSYAGSSLTVSGTLWDKYGAGHYAAGYSENPDQSPLLLKPKIGGQDHGGGHYWTENDEDYKAIRQWIAEGGQNN